MSDGGRRSASVNATSRTTAIHGRTYSCPHCHFVTSKKQIFYQHSSLHQENVQSRVIGSSSINVGVPPAARYCSNCDIQFSSPKTYHVHKQYYCSTRHVLKPINNAATPPTTSKQTVTAANRVNGTSVNSSKDDGTVSANGGGDDGRRTSENSMLVAPQVLTFPSASPVILVPYPYIPGSNVGVLPGSAAGLLVPNGHLSSNGAHTGFIPTFTILSNGQPSLLPVTAVACSTAASQLPRAAHRRHSTINKNESNSSNVCTSRSTSSPSESTTPAHSENKIEMPLDLSVKKGSTTAKSETSNSPMTSDKSEESPPPPELLPAHEASSSINQSRSPSPVFSGKRTSAIFISPVMDNCTSQTSPRLGCPIISLPTAPSTVLKQGTNKCMDCGVVFYKKENYLVHRRHYCAARAHKSGDDGNNSPPPLPPPTRRRKMSRISSNSNDEFEEFSDHDTTDESNHLKKLEEDGSYENGSKASSPSPTLRSSSAKSCNNVAAGGGGLGALLAAPVEPTSFDKHFQTPGQFACNFCSIKFKTLNTLQAHQTYYCLKKSSEQQSSTSPSPTHHLKMMSLAKVSGSHGKPSELCVVRCGRCLSTFQLAISSHETEQIASLLSNLKCPLCEASSPNSVLSAVSQFSKTGNGNKTFETQWAAASNHGVAAGTAAPNGTRSLRCTICGYRGNTLRGMKTHIRMHLDRGTEAQEESFISCVLPNGDVQPTQPTRNLSTSPSSIPDGVECDGPRSSSAVESGSGDSSKFSERPVNTVGGGNSAALQHACDYCGYTSSYKGNVVRHVRLVHKDVLSGTKTNETDRSSVHDGQSNDNCRDDDEASGPDSYRNTKSSPGRLSVTGGAGSENEENGENEMATESHDESNEGVAVTVKSEPKELSEEMETNAAVRSKTPTPTGKLGPNVTVTSNVAGDGANNSGVRRSGPKYCKSCDISFTYLSTFIAHKKFYCASHASENLSRETPVQ
ncbi:hypothetical protein CHUAL_008012 [Chamberlinius hualienensis]